MTPFLDPNLRIGDLVSKDPPEPGSPFEWRTVIIKKGETTDYMYLAMPLIELSVDIISIHLHSAAQKEKEKRATLQKDRIEQMELRRMAAASRIKKPRKPREY